MIGEAIVVAKNSIDLVRSLVHSPAEKAVQPTPQAGAGPDREARTDPVVVIAIVAVVAIAAILIAHSESLEQLTKISRTA